MDNTIYIFFSISENYVEHCCTSITSLLENNYRRKIYIYILSDYLSGNSKTKLKNMERRYANVSIMHKLIDRTPFKLFERTIDYISEHTYYRYVIAELFPQLNKGLYLDADLIVNNDLSQLWDLELDDNYCAGAPDNYIERIHYKKQIGFSDTDLYVNAGVLLLNLKKMREDSMMEKLHLNTIEFANKDRFQDQDAINRVFKDHIVPVPPIYNFTTEKILYQSHRLKDAIIVHYTGEVKPWQDAYSLVAPKNLYLKYEKLTKQSDDKPDFWNEYSKGEMNRIIKLYSLFRQSSQKEYVEQADTLLNELFENCTSDTSLVTGNGLCSIGIGVEYLLQKGFVEGDRDEILEEIDRTICEAIITRSLPRLNLISGLCILGYYFYFRLRKRKEENQIVLHLKEYLLYLIDWMFEMLPDARKPEEYSELYFTLNSLQQLHVINAKIEKMMRAGV